VERGVSRTDDVTGGTDLYPAVQQRWNAGSHNFTVYAMGGIPVGAYEQGHLANLGLNHWSLDGGGGYTFLSPTIGFEFSTIVGFTVNFENPDTDYRNGVNFHADGSVTAARARCWGLSNRASSAWDLRSVRSPT
jgi:hypothetical protein